ncbi:MAG: TetR/AcrR family transcriptional regulator C-terminal domain-containing protein [Traorella sp.]
MDKTKAKLGNALKQLSHEKPFSRISVSDITSKCDLNRQTFYYHFQDKYECLEWVYRHDCLLPLTKEMKVDNWDKNIEKMLLIMSNDKEFYIRSIQDNPKTFMDLFMQITKSSFLSMIQMANVKDKYEDLDEEFISEFLAMGIVGTILNWVVKGMKLSPLKLSMNLKKMFVGMRHVRKNA